MIRWTQEMSVGVGIIDKQHQEFIGLINDLTDHEHSGHERTVTGLTLMKLDSYSRYHFSTEEEYFILYDYPEAAEHVTAHRLLLKDISNFIDRFFNKNEDVAAELGTFLFGWLNDHLLNMDRKYTKCFNDHGLM